MARRRGGFFPSSPAQGGFGSPQVARRPMQPTQETGQGEGQGQPELPPQADPMMAAGNGTGRGPISPMNIAELLQPRQTQGAPGEGGQGQAYGMDQPDPMGGDFSMILRLLQGMGRV